MDKYFYSPLELLKIATEHAYCAEHLLSSNAEVAITFNNTSDALAPIASLMYTAFELTFKAYLLLEQKQIGQYKKLSELIELNPDLQLSTNDKELLKNLSRHMALRKGIHYELWDSREEQQVFCTELLNLYERVQELMPLELQADYHV